MSLINTQIAPFQATAYHNGKFVPVSEENFRGKWSVVVFYPADFTFVCPTELADLADNYDEFKRLGVEIYGVSTDTHFTHKAWHDTSDTIGKIQYPMLGDPTGTTGEHIPVLGRILCLADCFDAMTSNRTYRKALPLEVALTEIRRCSGTQFDPKLTDVFLRIGADGYRALLREYEKTARRMVAAA